jgi:hypothetical protein
LAEEKSVQKIIDLLATILGSAALLMALAGLFKAYIGEWLIGKVRQGYAKELEQHKAWLKTGPSGFIVGRGRDRRSRKRWRS